MPHLPTDAPANIVGMLHSKLLSQKNQVGLLQDKASLSLTHYDADCGVLKSEHLYCRYTCFEAPPQQVLWPPVPPCLQLARPKVRLVRQVRHLFPQVFQTHQLMSLQARLF
jgi:hypothetical protein